MLRKRRQLDRPRCNGEWTEARFWGFIRTGLRHMSHRWPPIVRLAPDAARRKYRGGNKRQKWEYQCAACGAWSKRTEVQVDHIVPCGSLKSIDDLTGFVERLFVEVDGLQVLCKDCHSRKE